MSENNDEKIKKAMKSAPVPDSLSPENIKKMLDEKAPAKKRRNIKKTVLQITAGAAACAVICGVGVHYVGQRNSYDKCKNIIQDISNENPAVTQKISENKPEAAESSGSKDYSEIYTMFKNAAEKYEDSRKGAKLYADGYDEEAVDEVMLEESAEFSADTMNTGGEASSQQEYSETYNQEEGVLEADIVKTDGKYIYYLYSKYIESESTEKQYINIAEADNGSFADSNMVDISDDFPADGDINYVSLHDMYLYNDMLIVIGSVQFFDADYNEEENNTICGAVESYNNTFVNVYTTGIDPQLVDSYRQDGGYEDVRITPEGYMYLITNDYSEEFSRVINEDDVEAYIPSYMTEGEECLVAPEDIILPTDGLDECSAIDYLIIGSLDVNTSGDVMETDIKALAGYSNNIYCSANNLYTAVGWEDTEITRFSLSRGIITPEASGTVKGYINDQFSMSEYDGYFRIATTYEDWTESVFDNFVSTERDSINNYVYVLDMDLNIVGSITDFGNDETIKSVNFNGNMAYVVTYEQTDPLFAIDLSDPEQPAILDEFKINGYSTYMQQWNEGLLLGFGIDADESGIETGVKLVMFDNTDPNNLNEVGLYPINGSDDVWIYSDALWERKALLIAPEKNLIGVPIAVSGYRNDDWNYIAKYMFFSYEDGQFILKGEIESENTGDPSNYGRTNRSIYIGDHIYILSGARFISADINSISQTDIVEF